MTTEATGHAGTHLIDPTLIYETFTCPFCHGSKVTSAFCPNDAGGNDQLPCDFCDALGYVDFANLSVRHARVLDTVADLSAALSRIAAVPKEPE